MYPRPKVRQQRKPLGRPAHTFKQPRQVSIASTTTKPTQQQSNLPPRRKLALTNTTVISSGVAPGYEQQIQQQQQQQSNDAAITEEEEEILSSSTIVPTNQQLQAPSVIQTTSIQPQSQPQPQQAINIMPIQQPPSTPLLVRKRELKKTFKKLVTAGQPTTTKPKRVHKKHVSHKKSKQQQQTLATSPTTTAIDQQETLETNITPSNITATATTTTTTTAAAAVLEQPGVYESLPLSAEFGGWAAHLGGTWNESDEEMNTEDVLASTFRKRYQLEYLSDDDNSDSELTIPPSQQFSTSSNNQQPQPPQQSPQNRVIDARGWERCRCSGVEFLIPIIPLTKVFENTHVDENIALETIIELIGDAWRSPSTLTSFERSELMRLLPNGQELQTAELLFSGTNFHFGNPLRNFLLQLKNGLLAEDVQDMREQYRAIQFKDYLQAIREYHTSMVSKATSFRKDLGIQRFNSLSTTSTTTSHEIKSEKEKERERTDSESSGEEAIVEELIAKRTILKRPHPTKAATTTTASSSSTINQQSQQHSMIITPTATVSIGSNISVPTSTTIQIENKPKFPRVSHINNNINNNNANTIHVPVFLLFNSLHSIFISCGGTASFAVLLQQIEKMPLIVNDIPSQLTSAQFLHLSLAFLSSPPQLFISNFPFTNSQLFSPTIGPTTSTTNPIQTLLPIGLISPPIQIPQIQHITQQPQQQQQQINQNAFVRVDGPDAFTWIEKPGNQAREDLLVSIEQLFWFLISRGQYNEEKTEMKYPTTKQQRCVVTIEQTSPEDVELFRRQETERYKNPELAFEYRLNDGRHAVVAPLKRGIVNPQNRPREHVLLKPDRPASVNILPLVRDAASKMPGGIGTRPDIVLLLKDSQYINENTSDVQINTIVSGALDRMHAEKDPCVRYDIEQKLWIYLHRHRSVNDFTPTLPVTLKKQQYHNKTIKQQPSLE